MKDIVELNGFVSVGPAILNDHAENYRKLVGIVPRERILVETDNTPERHNDLEAIYRKVEELYGITPEEIKENYGRF